MQQAAALQSKIDKYQQQDTLVVVEDYLQLYELPAEVSDLSNLDTNIVAFGQDVQNIIVKLHQSPDVQTYARELEASGLNSGKEELLELTQLLGSLGGAESDCVELADLSEEHPEKKLLRYLQGHPGPNGQEGNIFLGVSSQEDLSKLKSLRFQDGEVLYYLYQGQRTADNEERWVLARLDKDGKASFRFYQIFSEQGQGDPLASQGDLKLFNTMNHQTVLKSGKNGRIYFQSQEGLVIKRDNITAPVIGNSMLPNGDLVIGRVNMTYVGAKGFNQNNVAVTQETVGFESITSSRNANAWMASGGVKYFPMKDRWSVSGNVRVYNFLLGYSDNLSGERTAQGTYVFDNNFVSVNSNLQNEFRASAGRQFMKGRGAATISTDFKKTTELKVIFLVL